ncbi:MAG: DUF2085 domain-containing protein [Bellilinea sp.]
MFPTMETQPKKRLTLKNSSRGLLILTAVALFGAWLILTPDGLLGKSDAIGYSVCHRIEARSFFIGDRQTPLCARCSGMYLGMLVSLIYLLRYGRRTEFPPLKITLPLSLFFVAFGVDGLNSYIQFFPNAPALYQPTNLLRLITGTGLGMMVPVFLVPVFHQIMWTERSERPALERWSQAAPLLGLVGLTSLAVYSEISWLLYPLAVLSAWTVPIILGICYALVWVMIFHKENTYAGLKQAWVPLLAGFTTAMLQIGLVDLLRYHFTGTWAGFQL